MNIFILDESPNVAARMLCDKHLVKMILETAQLLCSPYEVGAAPYKRTHYNHPCSKWARESKENYEWLLDYGMSLCHEYSEYFGRIHKSESVILWCFQNYSSLSLESKGLTEFALAMPEQYRSNNPVEAYRKYYLGEKRDIAKWSRGRKVPEWYQSNLGEQNDIRV